MTHALVVREGKERRVAEAAACIFHAFDWFEATFDAWNEVYRKLRAVDPEACKAEQDRLDAIVGSGFDPCLARRAADAVMDCLTWPHQPEGVLYWNKVYRRLRDIAAKADPVECVDDDFNLTFETPPTPMPVRSRKRSCFLPDMIDSLLSTRGYRVIGEGMYSKVYAHDAEPEFVIKVSKRADDWPAFVKWGEDNGYAGTFTPKIVSMKVFKGGYYIAKMERLQGTIAEHNGEDLYEYYKEMKRIARYGSEHYLNSSSKIEQVRNKAALDLLTTEQPGCVAYLDHFRKEWGRDATDLHDRNWMVRGDSQIVMTDPVTDCGRVSGESRDNYRVKSSARVFAMAA